MVRRVLLALLLSSVTLSGAGILTTTHLVTRPASETWCC